MMEKLRFRLLEILFSSGNKKDMEWIRNLLGVLDVGVVM